MTQWGILLNNKENIRSKKYKTMFIVLWIVVNNLNLHQHVKGWTIVMYAYNGVLHASKKEQTADMHKNLSTSQK